jgi:type IV secretion system protein VirD4
MGLVDKVLDYLLEKLEDEDTKKQREEERKKQEKERERIEFLNSIPLPKTAERARKRPWTVPYYEGSLVNYGITTYGDARVAIPEFDHGAMAELLKLDFNAVFLGASLHSLKTRVEGWEARYSGGRHLMTVAPTRTGKGSCCIIPNLLMLDERSIFCIDPKGQNAAVTRRMRASIGPVWLLNPFNEHGMGTQRFNPLARLNIESPTVVADVSGIAEALIVSDDHSPHWGDSARDLVKALIFHLLETEGGNATLPKMRALLTQDAEGFLTTIVRMGRSKHPFIANRAHRFKEANDEISSIISTAKTQTEFLDDPGIAHVLSGSDFEMLDLKARPSTLFIILPGRYMMPYARFLRLLVVSALDQLCSQAGGTRTLFMLDEFHLLGHLSAVETAFALAAGYNVQLWPFVHDLSQLKDIYKDRWESFIGNCGVVQWFTPNDAFTAEYLSKRIGKTTVRVKNSNEGKSSTQQVGLGPNITESYNSTESEAGVDFFSPQSLFDLPDYLQIVTLAGFKYPIMLTRDHYFDWNGPLGLLSAGADPDPFHLAPGQSVRPATPPPPVAPQPIKATAPEATRPAPAQDSIDPDDPLTWY